METHALLRSDSIWPETYNGDAMQEWNAWEYAWDSLISNHRAAAFDWQIGAASSQVTRWLA